MFFYGHLASPFRENSGVHARLGFLSPVQPFSIVPPGTDCLHLLPGVLFWLFLWPRGLIIWCEPWSNPWALCPATTGVSCTFQIYGNWFWDYVLSSCWSVLPQALRLDGEVAHNFHPRPSRADFLDAEFPSLTDSFRSFIMPIKAWNSLWLGTPNCYSFLWRIWLFTALLILLYSPNQLEAVILGLHSKTPIWEEHKLLPEKKISHGYVHALKDSQSLSASCSGIQALWSFAVFTQQLSHKGPGKNRM